MKITLQAIATAVFAVAWIVFVGAIQAAQPSCGGRLGTASWYGIESGDKTATGAYFDGRSMTAAMRDRSLFGKRVGVTLFDKKNNPIGHVTVTVNDYGPAARTGRIIDLASAAADVIGLKAAGTGKVCIEVLGGAP